MKRDAKFVFITGGVVSSLGKGLAAASLGALLENRGLKVGLLKLDPYINVDPGTMSPFQHGEVFVTDDGAETDLDLGHYERFTEAQLSKHSNCTSGRIYQRVINKERQGTYQGATVQVIPHITDEIKAVIWHAAADVDVCIVEIGGTVGDIESLPFLEAIRQVRFEVGPQDTVYMHVTLVPFIKTAKEVKTKPTQHSVRELREIGIVPNILLCRAEQPLGREVKEKIALFANCSVDCVFSAIDVPLIYELPIKLHEEGLDNKVAEILNIWSRPADLQRWHTICRQSHELTQHVNILIAGKYVELADAYKSLHEALLHGGLVQKTRICFHYIDSEMLEQNNDIGQNLLEMDGILVPGGFGGRGIEGKILAAQLARQQQIPFLGICLGMQAAVIEYARNVLNIADANSEEFTPDNPNNVIVFMPEQSSQQFTGGTMRLGAYPCRLSDDSKAFYIYQKKLISERHRHRFEVNNAYRSRLEEAGLLVCGTSVDNHLVEMVEIKDHPFFIGCQFHPEFKSKPFAPHPLFTAFVTACLRRHQQNEQGEK